MSLKLPGPLGHFKFFTKKDWTFAELNKLSQKLTGKWTWPTASLLWLLGHGYEIKLIETFSYEEFGKKGKEYLIEAYGQEVANAQEANSDLAREQKLAAQFVRHTPVACQALACQIPDWNDLKKLFADNYIIICNINACQLHRRPGYSGHFVVIEDVKNNFITLHDPGLPPSPSVTVAKKIFEKAWGYPSRHEKNLLAIRTDASPKVLKSF